jgi:hypothetical protein
MPEVKTPSTRPIFFKFEYVTSAVSLLEIAGQGDSIVVHVVNDSVKIGNTQVFIYQNTGAGAITVYDTGTITIVPTWTWGLGFTIKESGEYWVRIQTTSDLLIPKVSFERFSQQGVWTPVIDYKPGDFAIFQLTPSRKRLW